MTEKPHAKLKVLLVCLTRRGGLLHFNDCLVQALQPLCDLRVVTVKGAEHIREKWVDPSREFHLDMGSGKKDTFFKLFSPSTWRFFSSILTDFAPDIVHITSAQEWNPALGFYFHTVKKLPLIYTLHDVTQHEGALFYMKITERLFRRQPQGMVVLSEQGKTVLVSEGRDPRSILVVPHGVYDFFTQYNQPDIQPKKEILFFGRIEPYKGIEILLKAAKAVLPRHPDWTLHIAGGGNMDPYQGYFPNPQIRLSNRFLSNEEVAKAMQRASIVALPYLSASQSGVIPTAFAFRKPVIATNVGGIPDMIRDFETGLLIPPNTVTALADALERLIQDEALRNRLGENGWHFAQSELGWQAIAKKHAAFYEVMSQTLRPRQNSMTEDD